MPEVTPSLDGPGYARSFEDRPWGAYKVLDEGPHWKVKKIEVSPRCRLSYQRHSFRSEHWYVTRGIGKVTIEGITFKVNPGEAIDIPLGAAHRVANDANEPLVFIEVQRGEYCGEDDIIRLQDDFGRPVSQTSYSSGSSTSNR